MKTAVLATLAVAATASAAEFSLPRVHYEKEFYDHITKYQVQLKDGAEFIARLEIFATNMEGIDKHNADATQTYKLGQNQFTHLTFDEFVKTVGLNLKTPNLRKNGSNVHPAPKDVSTLPASVDWRTASSVVTAVKDQGNCGSCWSFSATGAIEGAYGIKYGTQADKAGFSEQQYVSCDNAANGGTGTDAGCNGGWMDDAFKYATKHGGLPTETAYPYTSGTTGKNGACTTGVAVVPGSAPTGFKDVDKSVSALQSAVAQQPVSIAIQANQPAFQSYKSGVLTGRCGTNLDHGVLAVGYGTEGGVDYWLVKNSWGTTWGDKGYIKIERSSADLCGVLDAASYPTL